MNACILPVACVHRIGDALFFIGDEGYWNVFRQFNALFGIAYC